ncbi:MAG: trans-2-enoyl-CoA reductase [Deltaproteobacteria bacterium SG8_13]|nr:MAG: trans-2-enoyl-CoA reductase [Deltaproteobacteria bacterium SG8_13]
MIIQPRIRRNICVNAHPMGCAAQVQAQIHYVRSRGRIDSPQKVLVIGASNGYGLAARIVSAFASDAATIGVGFERPGNKKRTGTAGWYNIEAFRREADAAGLPAYNINGDAFSDEIKREVERIVRNHLGQIDFLVYSIAAPRRIDPDTGEIYSSVIKPIGGTFTAKTVDFHTGEVGRVSAEPANKEEISQTVKVMGGEDWMRWVEQMMSANLLSNGFLTIAFSYIGSEHTRALYRDGTIGAAKKDLEQKTAAINQMLQPIGGRALISVNKALVTRASAVIPAVPLYIALLYKVMKEKQLHEGCIQQMHRLYSEFLFTGQPPAVDAKGRIRIDDWEMREDVQKEVARLWQLADTGNLKQLADVKGLREEFLRHHGFGMPGVDYRQDVPPDIF